MGNELRGVTYMGRNEALDTVGARVEDVEVVLDLGPGICPQPFVKKPYVHICVEAHRPYIEHVKREVNDDPRYVFINSPLRQRGGSGFDGSQARRTRLCGGMLC